ncbi:unnamed protein product [Arctia plantaginis]|uniref:Transporter n=1 Tax=Arctia plantaginis TaxID=874455 RepID=A0A8S0ZWD1_ARCPL|nr:unnamed protein product [Arctia plantaginis]CAB3236258.1 unnamed protein product [Arctia plantaginis]
MAKSSNSSQSQASAVTKNISAMDKKIVESKEQLNHEPAAEDAEPERGNWTGRFDFLLSLLGYSVGLGNVWRFPYLCYNNGGGAFLIPFTIMLIIAGLPLMFMELSFGQYAALGPVAVYNKFCPLFQGLGYGMAGDDILDCYSYEEADDCDVSNGTYYLRQCYNQTYSEANNIVELAKTALRRPPAEEYFTNQVLGLSSGIEETGHIRFQMAVCLFAAWLIVFLCLCKGVQSSGKVWGDAAVQIFFALSPAWGGLITLSSYNKFSNNCYIDSLIVAVSNIATSFFAGLVIFSVIGFLAHELNVSVDRVVDQGAGLAFIVYPEVVTRLPVSPLWSILFFVMLLTLGLDSQFALMETVTTAILDRFPNYRQKKVWVVFFVAVFGYLGGLIFTTNSGMYWLQLMDKYAANWSVLIIAIGECILIAWIYGAEKFCRDIQSMIGPQTKLWVFFWSAMWRVITPAALVFILVFNWIEYRPASYGSYVYPMWADAIGWTLGVLPVVVVVLMAIDQICSGPDDLTIMETSQDGGDTTSITSGVENEIKKTGAIIKTKRNSIKRKVQSLSHESDDAVVEPLLQKDKEKTDTINQSAKYNLLPKTKTDFKNERESDKTKLLKEDKKQDSLMSDTQNEVNAITPTLSSNTMPKYTGGDEPLHNHMNTNVFNSPDTLKGLLTSKTQVLVEIDASKKSGISPSPLIFTTAKIHSNDKTKHMEPLQVTPVPILTTIEVSIKGAKNSSGEPSGTVTSNVSTVPCNMTNSNKNIPEKKQNLKTSTFVPEPTSKIIDIKELTDKNKLTQNNKAIANESTVMKDFKIGSKLPSNSVKDTPLRDVNNMNNKEENVSAEKLTKVSLRQGLGSSTSDEIKSTIPSAVCKSINTPVTAQASSSNYDIKQIPNDKTAQTTKMDKTNVFKISQPETDFNKNITSRDNCTPRQSNKSETTYQDKLASNASTSSKHLQRQKYAIDKEDSTSKLQCIDKNPSPPTSKIVIKPHDIGTSITKSATLIQSSANDINSKNSKTNLPKSTANDVHITSPISNKLPSSGNVTSANKTATSNSFKPIMSPHNIPSSESKTPIAKVTEIPTTLVAQNETIAKPSSNDMITIGIGNKTTDSNLPSKPQTSIKPLIAVPSSAKIIKVPMVDIPTTLPNQAVTNINITNIPSASSSTLTETIVNNPSVSPAKAPPVSTTIAKTLSSPACTINSLSTISAKASPVYISDTKNSSLPATSAMVSKAKTTTVTTTTINTPPLLTNTPKNSTGLKGTAKAFPVSTTIAMVTSASIPTDKTSKTPTTSDGSHQVTSSSVLTSVTPAPTDSTSKALPSHKRSQELTNGNKSLNA